MRPAYEIIHMLSEPVVLLEFVARQRRQGWFCFRLSRAGCLSLAGRCVLGTLRLDGIQRFLRRNLC